nr:hypothetical protein [Myxococcus sp. RHSTA-1-4]
MLATRLSRPRGGALLLATVLAVLGFVPEASAGSRFEFDAPVNMALDRSYVFYSPSRIRRAGEAEPSGLVFEAQVAPNLFFPQLHVGEVAPGLGEYIFSAVLTPHIRLRMLAQESSPVIPPSFMPKLTLQAARLWTPRGEGEGAPTSFGLALVNVVVGHYSNGQAGCFYANQSRGESGCVPTEGALPLNELSGDFSTNFLRVEGHARYLTHIDVRRRSAWGFGASAFIERNTSLAFGGITSEMREVYGDGHFGLGAAVEHFWFEHRFRAEGHLSRPYGESPRQPWTLSLEAAALPRWGAGFGGFVRYVRGQDYYNVLFLQRVSLVQVGLIFELGPGLRAQEGLTSQFLNPQ